MRSILLKYGAAGKPEDYVLFQYITEEKGITSFHTLNLSERDIASVHTDNYGKIFT